MKLNAVKTTVVLSANSFSGLFQFFYVDTVKFLGKACDILKYAAIYSAECHIQVKGACKSIRIGKVTVGTAENLDCIVCAVQWYKQ